MTTDDEATPFRLAAEERADLYHVFRGLLEDPTTINAVEAHVSNLCESYRDQGLVEGDLAHDGTIRAEVEAE